MYGNCQDFHNLLAVWKVIDPLHFPVHYVQLVALHTLPAGLQLSLKGYEVIKIAWMIAMVLYLDVEESQECCN